jgi:hypothetical protein
MSEYVDSQQEKEARGERLKRVRLMAGLSRKEIGEGEFAIHSDTYKGWEIGRFGGLTDKGAQKVVEKLKAHGVSCSVNWLLYGIGVTPFQNHSEVTTANVDQVFENYAAQISKELAVFKEQENAIDFCIVDDSMAPWYLPGDIVAGIKVLSTIRDGIDSIVQLPSGEVLLRKAHHGKEAGCYNLLTHKPDGELLTEVPLAFIAPVLWWRRPMGTVLKKF